MKQLRIGRNEVPKAVYQAMLHTEEYLQGAGINRKIYHLVKLRASMINGCGYCIDMHTKEALRDGEELKRLYLTRVWREAPCYTDQEEAALHLTEVLTNIQTGDVDEAFAHVEKHFSKAEIANLTLLICQINSWNRIAITFGNEPGSYES